LEAVSGIPLQSEACKVASSSGIASVKRYECTPFEYSRSSGQIMHTFRRASMASAFYRQRRMALARFVHCIAPRATVPKG
jgi:hypothetical protein